MIALVTKPKEEWQSIKSEKMSVADMFTKYAIILAAIPAVAGFIGYTVVGISVGFGTFRIPVGRTLKGRFYSFIIQNINGADFSIDNLEAFIDVLSRKPEKRGSN